MNNTELKIFTMYYINEHDDLSKEEKLALMEWVKDATPDQVGYLLLTGEVKEKLTEEDMDLLNDKYSILESWQSQWMSTAQQQDLAAGSIVATVYALAAIKAGFMAYKRFFSQAAKACAGRSGVEKTSCMNQFKTKALQAQIKVLQSAMGGCSKSKDPVKCKAKLQNKINKIKAKMGQL